MFLTAFNILSTKQNFYNFLCNNILSNLNWNIVIFIHPKKYYNAIFLTLEYSDTYHLMRVLPNSLLTRQLYYWKNKYYAVFEVDPKWFSGGTYFYTITYGIFYQLALAAHFYESLHYAMLELQYPDYDFHEKYHILQIFSNWPDWGPIRVPLTPFIKHEC